MVPRRKDPIAVEAHDETARFNTAINIMATLIAQFGSNCQASLYALQDGAALLHASTGTVMDIPPGSRLPAALIEKFRKETRNRAPRMQFTGSTPDGRRLSSSLTAICDPAGSEIGLLKIDFCIEHLISSIDILQTYCGIEGAPRVEEQGGDDDIGQMVDGIIAEAFEYRDGREKLSGKEYRVDVVRRLEEKNVFRVKGAVEIVSSRLNVSKYTIYNYLDQVRSARSSR